MRSAPADRALAGQILAGERCVDDHRASDSRHRCRRLELAAVEQPTCPSSGRSAARRRAGGSEPTRVPGSDVVPRAQPLKSAHPDMLALSTPRDRLHALEQLTADGARLCRLQRIARFDRQQRQVLAARSQRSTASSRSKERSSSPATNSTIRLNPICAATSDRAMPDAGRVTPVAKRSRLSRHRGGRPKRRRNAEEDAWRDSRAPPRTRARANPSHVRGGRDSRSSSASPTMSGTAAMAHRMPSTVAANVSTPDSTSTCCSSRPRPAPIEARSAISRARAAPLAQQQVRDIGACDEQHDADDCGQGQERTLELAVEPRRPVDAVADLDRRFRGLLARFFPCRRQRLPPRSSSASFGQSARMVVACDVRRKPSPHLQPTPVRCVERLGPKHHVGNPDIGQHAWLGAGEVRPAPTPTIW